MLARLCICICITYYTGTKLDTTSRLLLPPIFIPRLPESALLDSSRIRGVQRAAIWVMVRARVTGVDVASHGPEYPCNPIHASPAALTGTSPMGAAAGWA